jgi:hypothetical protein
VSTFPGCFNVVPLANSSTCLAKALLSQMLNFNFSFDFFFCGLRLSVGVFLGDGPWDRVIPKLVSAV